MCKAFKWAVNIICLNLFLDTERYDVEKENDYLFKYIRSNRTVIFWLPVLTYKTEQYY